MTDKEIIEHFRNNNYAKSVKGLYSIFPFIKKHIKTNNGTEDDAKDIFQDALVIFYKKIHSSDFILNVPLQYFLFSIVKNCWLQELRRRKKMPIGENPEEIMDNITDDEHRFNIASTAFNLLGEKCRELLTLFYFKKKSFKEIATTLSFSDEKIAKNQKYRCLQKAKENFLTLSNTETHGK